LVSKLEKVNKLGVDAVANGFADYLYDVWSEDIG